MSKISDLPSTASLPGQNASLQNLGGASSKVGNSPESENASDQNGAVSQNGDSSRNIKMSLALGGQLWRHKLQSFDRPQNKAEHKNHQSAESFRGKNDGTGKTEMPRTALRIMHYGLMKHAEKAGLPVNEQKEFAYQHTKIFEQNARSKGNGELLDKNGDLSLLSGDSATVEVKADGDVLNVKLGSEAEADLRQRLSNNALTYKGNQELQLKLPQTSLSANVQTNSQTQANAPANVVGQTNADNAEIAQMRAGSAVIYQAANNLTVVSSRDIAELESQIEEKVRDILREIGVFRDENPEDNSSEEQGVELPMPEEAQEIEEPINQKIAKSEDDALFTSTLEIADDSEDQLRSLHGDSLPLKFKKSDYSTSKLSFGSTILNLVQNGSSAGINELLDAADVKLDKSTLDGLTQISKDLGRESTSNLVVGVVTMSVMTREVVERLDHVPTNSSINLSDDALAALQRAQNSLRDCLTATDIIGAVGDAKGAPISIAGNRYDFLSEVREATNILREARQKVLGESFGASGTESQQRFRIEADALFKIASNVERMLTI